MTLNTASELLSSKHACVNAVHFPLRKPKPGLNASLFFLSFFLILSCLPDLIPGYTADSFVLGVKVFL